MPEKNINVTFVTFFWHANRPYLAFFFLLVLLIKWLIVFASTHIAVVAVIDQIVSFEGNAKGFFSFLFSVWRALRTDVARRCCDVLK